MRQRRVFWIVFLLFMFQQKLDGMIGNYKEFFTSQESTLSVEAIDLLPERIFNKQEFCRITGIEENKEISLKTLESAHQLMMLTGRVVGLSFDFSFEEKKKLIVTLCPAWIFKKISITPPIDDEEKYKNLYSQKEGEPFDIIIHESDSKKIEKELFDNGFFNVTILDELIYKKKDYTIKTILHVQKKKRFTINKLSCLSKKKIEKQLLESIEQYAQKKLLYKKYKKKRLKQAIESIKKKIMQAGYLHTKIRITKKIYLQKNEVALELQIDFGCKNRFFFDGNSFFCSEYLYEKLLHNQQPSWLLRQDIIQAQLQHEYFKNGYWATEIRQIADKEKNNITFMIKEKSPVRITALHIVDGNSKNYHKNMQDNNQYKEEKKWYKHYELVHASYSNCIKELLGAPYLSEKIDKLAQTIIEHYNDYGFFDAAVEQIALKKNLLNHTATIFINSKQLYLYKESSIEIFDEKKDDHNTDIRSKKNIFCHIKKELKKLLNNPEVVTSKWLHKTEKLLLDYLYKKGYWKAHIATILEKTSESKTLTTCRVIWKIYLNEPTRFGKTIIKGATTIPYKKIAPQLTFQEGEQWDQSKIKHSCQKLKNMHIFKAIKLQPLHQTQESINNKTMLLFLNDRERIEMRCRFGFFYTSKNFSLHAQSTPSLGCSWKLSNPTNNADQLTLSCDWTRFEQQHFMEYEQPAFPASSTLTKCRLFYHRYTHPKEQINNTPAYTTEKKTLSIALSQEYRPQNFWSIQTGIECIKTIDYHNYLFIEEFLLGKNFPRIFIEASLLVDSRDNNLDPRSGTLVFISGKNSYNTIAKIAQLSLQMEQSAFLSMNEQLTLAGRYQVGYFFDTKVTSVFPTDRFYLGGAQTVRGYAKDSVPADTKQTRPESNQTISTKIEDQRNNTECELQGGTVMLNLNAELRVRVIDNFHTAFFIDSGSLSQEKITRIFYKPCITSGVGFRYMTPLGAFRCDIAFKCKKDFLKNEWWAWHLSLGQAF